MSIELANESGVAVDETSIVSVCRFTLDAMELTPLAELSVVLLTEAAMAELNERWMDAPGPTDVLAFPQHEPGSAAQASAEVAEAMVGDLVLCPAFAERQANQAQASLDEELRMLSVHGILHLLGYDHGEPAEEQEMFGLQHRLLAEFTEASASARKKSKRRSADDAVLGAAGLASEAGAPGDSGSAGSLGSGGATGPAGDPGPAGAPDTAGERPVRDRPGRNRGR